MSHNNINIRQLEVILIGLFISRFDRRAIKSLDYSTFTHAFIDLGNRFRVSPNSIKLCRDKFDPYYDNPRVGLRGILPSLYVEIMKATDSLSFAEFYRKVKTILENPDWYLNDEKIENRYDIINTFFHKLKQEWPENDDYQKTHEPHEPHNSDKESYQLESWHIDGNIRDFIVTEKKYKDAYRLLLPRIEYTPYFEDENDNQSYDKTGSIYEKWFLQRIENENDTYDSFIQFAREVLIIVNRILPKGSKLFYVVRRLMHTIPEQNVMSCVCFHAAMMNICDLVHLHRKPGKYKTGLMLINKAEDYLGLGRTHHIKVTLKLVHLCTMNWLLKTIDELRKLIGKNVFYKPSKLNALDVLEVSIPLAKCAYNEIYKARLITEIRLHNYSITLSNGFELEDGKINLPLGLKGYIASCPGVRRVVIGFRGTSSIWNVITDLAQYLVGVSLVYKMALGLLLELKEKYPDRSFWVLGHSLGGGLTQFAVAGMDDKRFVGFGYNSAGLSNMAKGIFRARFSDNIVHLHLKDDQVFFIGNQLGGYTNQNSFVGDIVEAHKIETMERKRQFYYGTSVKKFLDSI